MEVVIRIGRFVKKFRKELQSFNILHRVTEILNRSRKIEHQDKFRIDFGDVPICQLCPLGVEGVGKRLELGRQAFSLPTGSRLGKFGQVPLRLSEPLANFWRSEGQE